MRKSTITTIVVILVIIVGGTALYLASKNDNKPTSNTSSTSGTTPASSTSSDNSNSSSQSEASGKVSMVNMAFTPSQVTINKGQTVTWANNDSVAHTVTVDSGEGPNSQPIQPGESFSYTFKNTGSFQYHCTIHSAMHGTIVVR